jgi:hypothetical protein
MDQDLRPDDKKAGWEWEVELARHIVEFAAVDQDDFFQLKEWKDRFAQIENSLGDKYLAKRFAIERAGQEAAHFKALAEKYTAQSRKFSRVVEQIKEVAVRDMQMHAEATGELEVRLKDKTRIKLYERTSKVVYYLGKPASEAIDSELDLMPDEYVSKKLAIGHLKNELNHKGISGFSLVEKRSAYVRWL